MCRSCGKESLADLNCFHAAKDLNPRQCCERYSDKGKIAFYHDELARQLEVGIVIL